MHGNSSESVARGESVLQGIMKILRKVFKMRLDLRKGELAAF